MSRVYDSRHDDVRLMQRRGDVDMNAVPHTRIHLALRTTRHLVRLVGPMAAALLIVPGVFAADQHPPMPAGPSGVVSSRTCLGCHDGTIARNVLVRDVTNPLSLVAAQSVFDRERRFGHPINSDYARAQANPRARLRPVAAIDPAIRLEDGRVGCASCHDLTSPRRAYLTVTLRGSVCLSCHDL